MTHISDFTKEEDQIILDLVNFDNETNLTLNDVGIGAITPVGEGQANLQLTAKPGSGFAGDRTVQYTRLNIQEFMDLFFPELPVFQQGEAVSVVDFLPEINAALGTNIAPTSVVDTELVFAGEPNEVLQVNLTIHPLSKVYRGQAIIGIDGNDIPLDSAVAIKVLSGLRLPGWVDAVDYQPAISAMIYPFEANVGQTESSVLLELSRYLGLPVEDLSFGPNTVLPSLADPEVSVTLVSNNPAVVFNGNSQTQLQLGIGRFEIPNDQFTNFVATAGRGWTWNATRGWYDDVTQPDTGAVSLAELTGLETLYPRLKSLGGTFTQYPLQASNGLGANYLSLYQGESFIRVGTWDQYNGVATQWVYKDNTSANIAGDVVNHTYRLNLPEPEGRPAITSIKAASAWRSGFNKGIRGMKDIFVELYVTKAPVKSKFFRLFIEGVQSDVYAEINDLALWDKDGNNVLTTDRVVAAADSSRYPNQSSDSYGPMKVIVDPTDPNSKWTSAGNAQVNSWISFELNEIVDLVSISIKPAIVGRAPRHFQLQISDNGVDWRVAKRFGAETAWTTNTFKKFLLDVPQPVIIVPPTQTMISGIDSRNPYQITGYQDRTTYATAGEHSMGSINNQLLLDKRDPQNLKVVRLRALFTQEGKYLLIGWEDTEILPSSGNFPIFTDRLTVSTRPGVTFVLSAGSANSTLGVQYGRQWLLTGHGGNFTFTNGQETTIVFEE